VREAGPCHGWLLRSRYVGPCDQERVSAHLLHAGTPVAGCSVSRTCNSQKLCSRQALKLVAWCSCSAELANVVNEATLLAARNDQEVVTLREMLEGVRRTK
jgi:hypothetical protein